MTPLATACALLRTGFAGSFARSSALIRQKRKNAAVSRSKLLSTSGLAFLKIKNNFIVGLRKPLYENGAEPGDLCLLVFDSGRRSVELQLGGPDLIDRITENISTTELYADPLLD